MPSFQQDISQPSSLLKSILLRTHALSIMVLLCALLAPASIAKAQPAELVKDIAAGSQDDPLSPYQFVQLGSITLFVGESSEFGSELWSTDGTALGTALLKDIALGPKSSDPSLSGVLLKLR